MTITDTFTLVCLFVYGRSVLRLKFGLLMLSFLINGSFRQSPCRKQVTFGVDENGTFSKASYTEKTVRFSNQTELQNC